MPTHPFGCPRGVRALSCPGPAVRALALMGRFLVGGALAGVPACVSVDWIEIDAGPGSRDPGSWQADAALPRWTRVDAEDAGPGGAPARDAGAPGLGDVGAGGPGDAARAGGEPPGTAPPLGEEGPWGVAEGGPLAVGSSCAFPWARSAGPGEAVGARASPTVVGADRWGPPLPALWDAPWAPGLWRLPLLREGGTGGTDAEAESVLVPAWPDASPVFPRAMPWSQPRRCWERPDGAWALTEPQAWAMWDAVVEASVGRGLDRRPGQRTLIGVRHAGPGILRAAPAEPDRFDDSLVLLWWDGEGRANVREVPASLDPGAWLWGPQGSGFLRPMRRHGLRLGWHRNFHAPVLAADGYGVRDDANHNGHWDSDRNGWRGAPPRDADRRARGHAVVPAPADAGWWDQPVGVWSSGHPVVPGMQTWMAFLSALWTEVGDTLDLVLLDARDIPGSLWAPCAAPDGSPRCPWPVLAPSFRHEGDLRVEGVRTVDRYNCSPALEGGNEAWFRLVLEEDAVVEARVEARSPGADPDVHLLEAADGQACVARGHHSLTHAVEPGVYWVVVDSWTDAAGVHREGAFSLHVQVRPGGP